jgi:hypothetical protein
VVTPAVRLIPKNGGKKFEILIYKKDQLFGFGLKNKRIDPDKNSCFLGGGHTSSLEREGMEGANSEVWNSV